MEERVALRVVLHRDGSSVVYPNFDALKCVVASGVPSQKKASRWVGYLSKCGEQPYYESTSSLHDHNPESGSPLGVWLMLLFVPKEFAEQALVEFSDTVSELTESDAAKFWEDHVTATQPDDVMDPAILSALASKKVLLGEASLNTGDWLALRPESPVRGIVKNPRKKWAGIKKLRNMKIVRVKKA